MKYFRFKLIAFVVALTAMSSCGLEDDGGKTCITDAYAKITAVNGPETITVGQQAEAAVTFEIANSCGTFINFAESNGIPKEVGVLVEYRGCNCDDAVRTETKNYKFTPAATGDYVLKFFVSQGVYITKTYTVTQ